MTLARVEKSTFQSELQHSNNFLNLLTPKSDWQLISPYHITPESNIKVRRIKELITYELSSWLLDKFSLSAP